MPVVGPEISCHPKDLLTNAPIDEPGRRWFVVYTMARQEKALARQLLRRQIPFYLPLRQRRLLYKGRRVLSYHPEFAGIVFLYATDQERLSCLAIRHVASVLPIPDQDKLNHDLLTVATAINSGGKSLVADYFRGPTPATQSQANPVRQQGCTENRRDLVTIPNRI